MELAQWMYQRYGFGAKKMTKIITSVINISGVMLKGMNTPSREITLTWQYLPIFPLRAILIGKNLLLLGANSFC